MEYKNRIAWIDIMRGILMITIVIGHVFTDGILRQWIYSFHVPAFFFLSGYCFHYTDEVGLFVGKKIRTIVVPYLFFSIVSITVFWLGSKAMPALSNMLECHPIKNIGVMLYGNSKPEIMRYNLPLWFLPCLFMTTIFCYGTEYLTKKFGQFWRIISFIFFFVLGVFFSLHETIALPWHLETACSMSIWFLSGIVVSETRVIAKICNRTIPMMILSLLWGGLLCMLNIRVVGVRNEHYGIIPLYYGAAVLGITGVMGLSIALGRNKTLEHIGRSILVILGVHKFPLLFFQEIVPTTKVLLDAPNTIKGIITGLFVAIISIGFSLGLNFLLEKYTPWLIGKKRKRMRV